MSALLPVAFIMGPTASGKTGLAMELLSRLEADIVSVDSAMIYTGMDIGTAKPTPAELERAPHALINVIDPAQSWSVGEFCEAARTEIRRSHSLGRIPLLTGGTMMYFRALESGLNELPAADANVREEINVLASEQGWPAVHAELSRYDPQAASRIHKNDGQRIQRAMEVFRLTGTPLSVLQSERSQTLEFPLIKIALGMDDRTALHRRIHSRFESMMQEGFLEEVTGLFGRDDLHSDLPSIRSVGYRQLWMHLEGTLTLAEASEKAMTATRQLAKRQMTWLRSDHNLHTLRFGDTNNASRSEALIRAASE